jgi:hypothetical protein
MDYVSQPGYDTQKIPGICAGISHRNPTADHHEFFMHFDD